MSPTTRPHRAWLWAGMAVAALLLACFGASCGSFVARQEAAARQQSAARSPTTPAPAAVRSASPRPAYGVRLPASLLGRAKASQKALVHSAEQAVAAQRAAETGAQSVEAAYYGSVNRKNLIFVLAVQAPSADPGQTYDRIVDALQQQQKGLRLAGLDPGTLGGQAGCGEAPVSGSPVTFCVWVDAGSYGFVEFFGVHVGPQRAQFLKARTQIESVS
jgi:hypothetical protein